YEVDSPNGNTGRETVLAVTPAAGRYTLQVAPLAAGAEGAFALVVHEVRPAGSEDRRRATSAAILAQAERQWQAGDFEKAVAGFRKVLPDLERRGEAREA